MYCNHCKTEYFTTLLSQSEKNVILFRATWQKYHCKSIIDDTMKCIKCKSILYTNIVTHKLMCLNQKCNFIRNVILYQTIDPLYGNALYAPKILNPPQKYIIKLNLFITKK